MGRDTSDLEINSLPDGQVVAPGSALPLELSSRDAGSHGDLEVEVSLTSPTGAAVWKHEPLSSPAVNEDLALALPDLPAGQYQLEIVVLSRGEQLRKRVSSLFIARDSYAISGIKSFPPVITTGSTVLLKAELAVPEGSDPYLRWTWKGQGHRPGPALGGAAQALWSAPAEEGVYSIHLELFPSAPATGADFTFSSSLIQSTDLYVTAGAHLARGDLTPEKSYWSLLHLQGNLADAGAGAKPGKSDASLIGSPQVVQVADGFGYRLDGRSGIAIPWLILPVEAGALAPFTITMGITPESFDAAQTILAVTAVEDALSLLITVDPAGRAPAALLTTAGHPGLAIPWQGPELPLGRRSVVSLSVTPNATGIRAAWFLDGVQVSRLAAAIPLGLLKPEGKAVLGGEKGFVGIVDELGVFSRDDQGRASTDPDLFARAARAAHGDSLVLASGFDGPFLPGRLHRGGRGRDRRWLARCPCRRECAASPARRGCRRRGCQPGAGGEISAGQRRFPSPGKGAPLPPSRFLSPRSPARSPSP